MSVQKIDNFDYRGRQPNFARDSVATLGDLLNANANHYPDGHIVYCQETAQHYTFNSSNEVDEITGRFRVLATEGNGDVDIAANNLPVAKPIISVEWIAHMQDGMELESVPNEGGTTSSPIVEKGYKMRYASAMYKWNAADGYQAPTSVDTGNSDWKDNTTPPASGEWSDELVMGTPTIEANTALKVTLQAKEVGYKTDASGYLVPASGYVKSSASVGVTFRNRLYYGTTIESDITEAVIKQLSSRRLVSGGSLELANLTTVGTKLYYVYAFPTRLSKITANGQDVWDKNVSGEQGFIETSVEVTNNAGYSQTYYAYRSTQNGNLSNTTLRFS